MSLRIIYGRAGSGKSRRCLEEIKEKLKQGVNVPLILIVPEQYSLQAERNLLEAVGNSGSAGAEVLSFRRLASRVFNEVGGITRKHIDPAGKCMLVQQVLNDLSGKLEVFARASQQPGFSKTITQTISEFKRYKITPQLLEKTVEGEEQSILGMKSRELACIYDEFEKRLQVKYSDADDDLTQLAGKLGNYRHLKGSFIWIDEFTGFTPQEYSVIEGLLRLAECVNICLCTDNIDDKGKDAGIDVFLPVKKAAVKLVKLANELKLQVDKPVCIQDINIGRFSGSKELAHLERQYNNHPYKTYGSEPSDLEIFCSSGLFSEVDASAAKISAMCRDKSFRYRDIAVAVRNLPAYERLIRAVFREYGIPCFIDLKREVSSHPLARLVIGTLKVLTENWSYEAVFGYLKTGFTNIAIEDIDIIENYVLACGIKGSKWTQEEAWVTPFDAAAENPDAVTRNQELLNRINNVRRDITGPFIALREATRGRTSVRELCTALYRFLEAIGAPERLEKASENLRAKGELDLANEYDQVWSLLMGVLDQAVEVMGDDRMTVERFHTILAAGIGEYNVGVIPPSLDQVIVGTPERSRNHDVKALFILGVNDGVFPAASGPEGILTDSEREKLQNKGLELAQDTRTRAFEEQLSVYKALTMPRNYLRISYPVADHEGKALRPSVLISRVKKIFPGLIEKSNVTQQHNILMENINSPSPAFDIMVAAQGNRLQDDTEQLSLALKTWFMTNPQWKERCIGALDGLDYTNKLHPVGKEKTSKLYGGEFYTSVSRLESYTACPFSYYIKYGLKARERKLYSLTPPDIGSFMHRVIDIFSREMGSGGLNWRNLALDECRSRVSDIIDELLGSMSGTILNSSKRYRFFAERLKRVLTRAVYMIAEHIKRGSFDPAGYELDFSEGGKYPPITIELPDGFKVVLTGRIDRLDRFETKEGTYLRIIDYKSGNKDLKLSEVFYGLKLQLITYLDAATGKDNLPGGALYFRLEDPIVKTGSKASDEEIEKAIMKQLKMKGLLLADVNLIREMDRDLTGDSLIIPARINKDETLGRSSAASKEQFGLLRSHTRSLLGKICGEMLKGEIDISPYKWKKTTPCTYCSYSSICQFDPRLKENSYRVLKELSDEEVWKKIGGNGETYV